MRGIIFAFLLSSALLPSILRGLVAGVIGAFLAKGFIALRDRPVPTLNTNGVSNEDLATRSDLPQASPEYVRYPDVKIYECLENPDCDFWVEINMEPQTATVG
ncbi:hypothetical protein B9Z19DRAFT_1128832 [Tuber borchii]|uniref:Uncharacterized protein n=1 Tax=Tuber borchii TaxID=42251 RepID=A0A2T6ZNK2_TUBBO|nr:hypothetical protein B9Z19DRAFT_1128832 [Tuber borchii]